MAPPEALTQLARDTAAKHGLDPALVCAVCEQESSWNPDATRFEPAFKRHYIYPLKLSEPEATRRATSWGLMQVMGQVAREHKFIGLLSDLLQPELGLDVGCIVLRHKLRQAGGDVRKALLLWNGGGRPEYADEVLGRMPHYQVNPSALAQSSQKV